MEQRIHPLRNSTSRDRKKNGPTSILPLNQKLWTEMWDNCRVGFIYSPLHQESLFLNSIATNIRYQDGQAGTTIKLSWGFNHRFLIAFSAISFLKRITFFKYKEMKSQFINNKKYFTIAYYSVNNANLKGWSSSRTIP